MQVNKNEGEGLGKPVTAWAVELDGNIDIGDVFSTRATARYIRTLEEQQGMVKKAHVRKVQIVPVKGR